MSQRSKEAVVQEFRIRSIQEAAMRVISRRGIAGATMQEIAGEAGVAKGTIYLYFRDRDELVEKTFESAMNELMVQIDEALAKDSPVEERLRAVTASQLRFFAENREFFRLYLSMRLPEGNPHQQRRLKRICQPQYRSRVQKLAGVLQRAMEHKEIRRADPYRLALFIIEGSMAIIIERLTEDDSPPADADIDLISGLILDGIRKRS